MMLFGILVRKNFLSEGVGPSGTGSYHGHDGFKEFSHAKAVYKQFSADLMAQMMPPYKGKMFESMKNQIFSIYQI